LVDPFFILLRSLGSGFFLKDEEIPETRRIHPFEELLTDVPLKDIGRE
jgi:hypothetical protein